MESVFIATVVIAITELLRRFESRDYRGVATICAAAIVGLIAGFLAIEGLDPISGLLAGLSAAGIVRGLQAVGEHRHA